MSPPRHEVPAGFGFLAPAIAQDLVCKEMASLLASAKAMEQARRLLALRQTRVLLLYSVVGVLHLAVFAAGVWVGAWLTGLPLLKGEALQQNYPLSFLVGQDMEPWGRYFGLTAAIAACSWASLPVAWLRRRVLSAWVAAEAALGDDPPAVA